MARKKQPLLKKFIIVGAALILIQVVFLIIFGRPQQPAGFKEAMNKAVGSKGDLPAERRPRVKLQIALSDYRARHKDYPNSLQDLVPDYFESVPIDPETGKLFAYKKASGHYALGEPFKGGAATAGQPSGSEAPIATDEKSALIASLDAPQQQTDFVYDPTGKRDPFRSYDFSPRETSVGGNTVLEKFTYDDLKFSAVLTGMGTDKAIIEDPSGKGHTVEIGTPVGVYGGKVVKIENDRLTILESSIDFTGQQQTRTIEMLRTAPSSKKEH
jgi:type IV pilus assembly protein PilP